MEMTKGDGESFAVDLNENEEQTGDGGVAGSYAALKERSLALLAGVSGGQEAGKTRTPASINGRNVNTDDSGQPPSHGAEILLGLVNLPGQLIDSCVISGVCGGLNGFTESLGQEEPPMVAGTTTASCPAVNPGEGCRGDTQGSVCGCLRTSAPQDGLSCMEARQRSCTCPSCPDVDMSNGVLDVPEGDAAYCRQTELLARQLLGQRLGFHDVDCEERKLANGALHFVSNATANCEWPDSDYSDPSRDSPAPGLSAKPPSPCTSTPSKLNSDSQLSEEDSEELRLPIRPQSLRTNPNTAVSLSCDATPLTPDEDGGFYFEDQGDEQDLRNVLEAGRRQSAPDKLPDLPEQTDGPDLKLMPKRFGIADFFTRYLSPL